MKKFILCITILIAFVGTLDVYPQNCLKLTYPHNPSIGSFNPDSVMVDSCKQINEHITIRYANKYFCIAFKNRDPYYLPYSIVDSSLSITNTRNWRDLSVSDSLIRNFCDSIENKFGYFVFKKVYPYLIDTSYRSSKIFYIEFSTIVPIDTIVEAFNNSLLFDFIYYYDQNANYLSNSNLIFRPGFVNVNNNDRDQFDGIYPYSKVGPQWSFYGISAPLASNLTKGSPDVIVDIHDASIINDKLTFTGQEPKLGFINGIEKVGNSNFWMTVFKKLNNGGFENFEYGENKRNLPSFSEGNIKFHILDDNTLSGFNDSNGSPVNCSPYKSKLMAYPLYPPDESHGFFILAESFAKINEENGLFSIAPKTRLVFSNKGNPALSKNNDVINQLCDVKPETEEQDLPDIRSHSYSDNYDFNEVTYLLEQNVFFVTTISCPTINNKSDFNSDITVFQTINGRLKHELTQTVTWDPRIIKNSSDNIFSFRDIIVDGNEKSQPNNGDHKSAKSVGAIVVPQNPIIQFSFTDRFEKGRFCFTAAPSNTSPMLSSVLSLMLSINKDLTIPSQNSIFNYREKSVRAYDIVTSTAKKIRINSWEVPKELGENGLELTGKVNINGSCQFNNSNSQKIVCFVGEEGYFTKYNVVSKKAEITKSISNNNKNLNKIFSHTSFENNTTIRKLWVVGDKGLCMKSTDDGNSWLDVIITNENNETETTDFFSIHFVNSFQSDITSKYGIIVGKNKVYYTKDGGGSWSNFLLGNTVTLDLVDVIMSDKGENSINSIFAIIVAQNQNNNNNSYLYKLKIDTNGDLILEDNNPIQFIDKKMNAIAYNEIGKIFIVGNTGNNGSVWRATHDNYNTWSHQDIGQSSGELTSVNISNSSGVIAATDKILVANEINNNPPNWSLLDPNSPNVLIPSNYYCFKTCQMLENIDFIMAGNRGLVYRSVNSNKEALWINKFKDNEVLEVDTAKAAFFTNFDEGWVVGTNGMIIKGTRTNNLLKWSPMSYPNIKNENFNAITKSDNYYLIVGNDNTIFKSNQPAESWQKVNLPPSYNYNFIDIVFRSSSNGYIITDKRKILVTTNSGGNWDFLKDGGDDILLDNDLNSIHFLNDILWITANNSTLYRFESPYSNYSKIVIPGVNFNIKKLCATSQYNYFCVGSNGVVMKSSDAGITWSKLESFSTETLNDIKNNGTENLWIAGNNGFMLKTTDGGAKWNKFVCPSSYDQNAIYFISLNNENNLIALSSTILVSYGDKNYEQITCDDLKRYYSLNTGYGFLNAFRCVAHSIRNKAPQACTTSTTLSFSSGSFGDGNINENSNMLMHMGAYNRSINNNLVLEYGGDKFDDSYPDYDNCHGTTYLSNAISLKVPNNCILAIDGALMHKDGNYGDNITTNYEENNTGKILVTGYLKDVKLEGLIKVDDLDIYSSTIDGYGKLLFKSIASENSEIYGIVNVNDYGKIELAQVSGNTLVIQPGGEINFRKKSVQNLDNDLIIPNGATLELAYGSSIKKIEPASGSFNCSITIQSGGTLRIQKGAAVTLDVPITVKPGGNLIFEDNTLAWIDNIIVEENDGINHGVIFNTDNTKIGTWILPATGKTGIITIQSGATVYIPQVDKTIHPKVTEIKIDSPVEILDGGSLTVSNEARLSVDKIILNETGSLNLMNGAVILPAEGKTGKVQIMPNALLTINGVSNSDKKNISILGGVDVFGTVEQTPNGFTLKKGEFNIKWVNLNIGPISSTSFTLIKIDESSVKLFAANSYNNNPKRQSIGLVKATIFGDFEILNSEFNTSKGSSSLIPNSTEDDFVVSQFSIINSGYPSIFPSEPWVNFTNSNFKNICFKVWDSHLEPIQNCTFIYNSADLKSNLDKDEFSGFSANSLLEKTITPWFPSSLGSSMLDLSLINCTFKDEAADNPTEDFSKWLTDRKPPGDPVIYDVNYHLIGVFAQNMKKVIINNTGNNQTDQFKGLNYGIMTDKCADVEIIQTKHFRSRVGIADAGSSVVSCQNITNQTQIPIHFAGTLSSAKVYDNEFNQSLYGIRLDDTKDQVTRGTNFSNYMNGIYVAKGETVLNGEKNPNIPGERYIEGRNKFTVDIPNNNIFTPEFITQYNNPQADVWLFNKGITNNQYRSLVRLYCGDNELALSSFRNIFNEIDVGTDNLEVNGERNNFQASTKVENIILSGSILNQPLNPDVPGCDEPPLQSIQDDCPSEPLVCTYFRNNVNWNLLQDDSTVVDAEFYSALNDLCDGQLSCDCYELKVRDLIQWATLDANPDSTRDKLMLIRACLQEKRNDSLSAFFSCAGDLIIMSMGEIEERMGNYQGAKKHFQDIHYFFPMSIDTMYSQWRYLYCEAMTIDTTFGAKYDSAMTVYLHRVAADISSKDTSTTPPGGQYKIGFDKELDEAPAFPPDPDFGEIESIAPNPLTNETVIRYRLKEECDIELIIYDWLGQETKTLVKGRYKKGNYVVTFQNEGYANSSYMCALRFNGAPGQVKIMQIVK